MSYSPGFPVAKAADAKDKTNSIERAPESEIFDPGDDQQRPSGNAELPPVRSFFHYPARPQWFPGRLLVVDLLTHEMLTIATGQADSEILFADANTVLYRVNDQIYSTHRSGGKFDLPTLLVKDEDVPEVHWIFWGSPLDERSRL